MKGRSFMLNSSISPAFARDNVPVVLAINNMYAPYAGVFIQSLLDHASERNNYDIIILERDISEENKHLLKSLAIGHGNVSVRFYDPSPLFASFNYVDEEHYFPLEIFYRIVAPHILNYPGRIITIDADTLLKTDIARLLDEDLGGCCVGGTSKAPSIYNDCLINRTVLFSAGNRTQRARDYWQNVYGLDYENLQSYKDFLYAGVLLFDCDKYRREVDVETILNTAQQENYLYPEEDVLYALMKGKIKLIDLAWNVVLPRNRPAGVPSSKMLNEIYNENEVLKRVYDQPYLLHWGGKPKPWVCPDIPYGSEWWQTALRTPFVGHIFSRMIFELEKRRKYYKIRYGKEDVDVWDPVPKGIDRTNR